MRCFEHVNCCSLNIYRLSEIIWSACTFIFSFIDRLLVVSRTRPQHGDIMNIHEGIIQWNWIFSHYNNGENVSSPSHKNHCCERSSNTCCLHIRPGYMFNAISVYSASWEKPFVADFSEMSQQISTYIATKTVLQSWNPRAVWESQKSCMYTHTHTAQITPRCTLY